MDAEDDEYAFEVVVTFIPRLEVLAALGITPDDLESALNVALDERQALAARDEVDFSPLEEMSLRIGGVPYRLEELAEVEIQGDMT